MTLIIVGGATATGKTELATRICKEIGGELVSADSMQIYKRMDIGTAKESAEELGVPVHCIDIVEPWEKFSVVDYKNHAQDAIADIEGRGKTAVICGGTGFYINSLVYDYSYGGSGYTEEDYNEIFEKISKEYEEKGAICLHERLKTLDPASAEAIHPNNTKRLLRALAVSIATGSPFSKQNNLNRVPNRSDVKMFTINYEDRQILAKRMALRVDKMIEKGLEAEVMGLLKEGVTFDAQSMQAIGYKEWREKVEGNFTTKDVAELIIKNTKAYGKRQRTWFGNQYPFAIGLRGEQGIDSMLKEVVKAL